MNVFLFTFLIILGLQILFFLIASTFKTDKVTDLAYGISFFIALWLVFLSSAYSLVKILIVIAVTIWGIRLAAYLFIRILKIGRDKRFDNRRDKIWEFAKFWILQTISIWIILLPHIWIVNQPPMETKPLFYLGLAVWAVGLTIEAIADQQKFKFKNNPENKGKWTNIGLWKYSRHPNYFGEILCWVGLFIAVIPYLSGLQYLFVISPIYITSLLLFVSGIPPLEERYQKKYGDNRKYQQYKQSTSILIPWFKKN
jgi:steroid 5-alpha reductase family enzyme